MFTRHKQKSEKHSDLYRVVYKSQTKARQALDKSRKSIKTSIYVYRVVYKAQTKARKALDRSRKFVKTMIYLSRVVYETKKYRQRRHQQEIKNLHSVFKYSVLLQKLEYKGRLHQALSSGEEISMLRLSTIFLAKSSTSGSNF